MSETREKAEQRALAAVAKSTDGWTTANIVSLVTEAVHGKHYGRSTAIATAERVIRESRTFVPRPLVSVIVDAVLGENKNLATRVQSGQVWRRRIDGYEVTIEEESLYLPPQWRVSHKEGRGDMASILESTLLETFDLVRDALEEEHSTGPSGADGEKAALGDRVRITVDEPTVIGVGGYKTSGKDAFAQALAVRRHYSMRGMSDPLQEWALAENPWIRVDAPGTGDGMATRLFYDIIESGVERLPKKPGAALFVRYRHLHDLFGYDEAKKIPDFRAYLQRIGTEAGRQIIGENVWVDVATERIMSDLAFGRNVVVTGIRYENEIQMIRDLGGVSVWIDRPVVTQMHEQALASRDSAEAHSSEVTLQASDFDLVLVNGGTLDDLAAQATRVADHIGSIPREKHSRQARSRQEAQ